MITKKILQKKIKKKRESDTWPAVNGVNYFFSERDLIDALFQK